MEITITKNPNPGTLPDPGKLVFGRTFTDHMFLMNYSREAGWQNPRIVPFGPLSLLPSASVFHYGAEIFEGLKAYRKADGSVQLSFFALDDPTLSSLREQLLAADLDNMTPLSAFDLLRKLKEEVGAQN